MTIVKFFRPVYITSSKLSNMSADLVICLKETLTHLKVVLTKCLPPFETS